MAVKWTILGLLIYGAMALYVVAAVLLATRLRKTGWAAYTLGFVVAAVAWGLRWQEVQHVPMQNMFEVFLCLGMLIMPISLFCRRALGVGGEAADAVIGFILLFPAGLVFNAAPQHLPPALQSWLFIPHVASYMLSYVIMAKAAVPAACRLVVESPSRWGHEPPGSGALGRLAPGPFTPGSLTVPFETATYRMVCLGFPLLTLGLVLGAVWGKLAWGDYWNWDPKELWSLVSWLMYLGYFHFRYRYGLRFPRVNSALALAGLVAIITTLLWVNLSRLFSAGMHSYAS
ncbi:MAG: cytochrome c biogenesis protein CcsA [Planctomycetes bacterium]|nr:cytochrome c biogenesis protein CcsA [Planctomycetota bacterium]